MPYEVRPSGKGYKVGHVGQDKTYSNKPMSRSKAVKQMKALYMATKKENGGRA